MGRFDDFSGQLCAIEDDMGLKTLGLAGGRADVWEASEDIYWEPRRNGWAITATVVNVTLKCHLLPSKWV